MPFDIRFWRPFIYAVIATFFLCGIVALWQPGAGFTRVIHFGSSLADQCLPAIKTLPIAQTPDAGYDGQFYAQLAVDPRVQSPDVQAAMDNVRYRGQRILLPVISHVVGGGDPWRILQVYAFSNVICWGVLAWLLHLLTAQRGYPGLMIWSVAMVSMAVLESVHLALTDLPAVVLIVGAVMCMQRDRIWYASLLLAFAGLMRETSLLAAVILVPTTWRDLRAWRSRIGTFLMVFLPACLWSLYLRCHTPATIPLGGIANFDWPGLALLNHLNLCASTIIQGQAHYRHIFAPIAAAGFAYQSFYILRLSTANQRPCVGMGVPFAILFWVLGENVWGGYWAVARACLPMTIAYCLSIPVDRYFIWRLLIPNLCLLHAIQRFFSSTL
jgi:hypothetical protein